MDNIDKLDNMIIALFEAKRAAYTPETIKVWRKVLQRFTEEQIDYAMEVALKSSGFFEISTILNAIEIKPEIEAADEWGKVMLVVNKQAEWKDLSDNTKKALLQWSDTPMCVLREGDTYMVNNGKKAFIDNYERVLRNTEKLGDYSVVKGLLNI